MWRKVERERERWGQGRRWKESHASNFLNGIQNPLVWFLFSVGFRFQLAAFFFLLTENVGRNKTLVLIGMIQDENWRLSINTRNCLMWFYSFASLSEWKLDVNSVFLQKWGYSGVYLNEWLKLLECLLSFLYIPGWPVKCYRFLSLVLSLCVNLFTRRV